MNKIDQMQEIIAKGDKIMNADVQKIKVLSLDLSVEDFDSQMPWIWEAIALIVNDPEYSGDCSPIE